MPAALDHDEPLQCEECLYFADEETKLFRIDEKFSSWPVMLVCEHCLNRMENEHEEYRDDCA